MSAEISVWLEGMNTQFSSEEIQDWSKFFGITPNLMELTMWSVPLFLQRLNALVKFHKAMQNGEIK